MLTVAELAKMTKEEREAVLNGTAKVAPKQTAKSTATRMRKMTGRKFVVSGWNNIKGQTKESAPVGMVSAKRIADAFRKLGFTVAIIEVETWVLENAKYRKISEFGTPTFEPAKAIEPRPRTAIKTIRDNVQQTFPFEVISNEPPAFIDRNRQPVKIAEVAMHKKAEETRNRKISAMNAKVPKPVAIWTVRDENDKVVFSGTENETLNWMATHKLDMLKLKFIPGTKYGERSIKL